MKFTHKAESRYYNLVDDNGNDTHFSIAKSYRDGIWYVYAGPVIAYRKDNHFPYSFATLKEGKKFLSENFEAVKANI